MTRTQARKVFTREDMALATAGFECQRDDGVIDEIPSPYKYVDAVIAAPTDLVEVVAALKQIFCVNG
jgi:tRNA-splicing ligase RtcB